MNGDWHPGPRPTYHNPACPLPSQPVKAEMVAGVLSLAGSPDGVRGDDGVCRGGAAVNSSKSLVQFSWILALCKAILRLIGLR